MIESSFWFDNYRTDKISARLIASGMKRELRCRAAAIESAGSLDKGETIWRNERERSA